MTKSGFKWVFRLGIFAVLVAGLAVGLAFLLVDRQEEDLRKATIVRSNFEERIVRVGVLEPVSTESMKAQVGGTIIKIVDDGARIKKGDLLLELDAKPHEESLQKQKAKLRRQKALRVKDAQRMGKGIRKAQDQVKSKKLRLDLEKLRLKEMKLGPGATQVLNAKANLENAKMLLTAKEEEFEVITSLGKGGFVARTEVEEKKLGLVEQRVKVEESELATRKLFEPDTVKLAEQELKVRDAEQRIRETEKRVAVLVQNEKEAGERYQRELKREQKRFKDLEENLTNTKHFAKIPGVVRLGTHWHQEFGPGRSVRQGWRIMTLSDLRKMKAILTVGEARIGKVKVGQAVRIRLDGPDTIELLGKVERVAEKGEDEFEAFRRETKDIIGKANRQVFEVEVSISKGREGLRPGARVAIEVLVQQLTDTLIVPRTAVFQENDRERFVRLDTPLGPERMTVRVVGENKQFCAIECEDLNVGQRVWLVRP